MPAANDIETIYLSPTGSNTWSGRLAEPNADQTDGPVATLAVAVERARQMPADQPRYVIVRAGEYFIEQPVILGPQDAGLIIESAPDETVVLYGGRLVTDWAPDGDNLYAVDLPQVAAGQWDFRALVVNGRYCPRSRLPAEGTFTHQTTFDVPWMSTTGGGWQRKPTEDELTTLIYDPADLPADLDVNNAELTVYHMWDESVVGLASIDPATHTLRFSNPAGHPPGAFRVQKYVIWNVREGMTQPGQWQLDRTRGKLVYWPLPDEDMTRAVVIAPTIESIIRIEGTEDQPASNITIRNLTLAVTNTALLAGGFGAGKFDGAIQLTQANDCTLADLEIRHSGGWAVKATGQNVRIQHCHIHDTGAGGILLRGQAGLAEDNHVHDVGLTYPSAIALWLGGQGHHADHNTIHDTPYTAIAAGGDDHRITGNLIYHAMQQLHDGAGIYITFCKRIELRGNFIRDITDSGGYGASAYYLDEQAEHCLVEGNLALRVARPLHCHMARKNIVRNNVFITDGEALLTFIKCKNIILRQNVMLAGGGIEWQPLDALTTPARNVLFSRAGAELTVKGRNVTADPKLTSFQTGRVEFAPDSPAHDLGIEPIDVSAAGQRP